MKDYYKRKIEITNLELTLIKEAITTRLHNGTVSADDFILYAELLKDVESSLKTHEDNLLKVEKEPRT